ncbi:MAG: M20/M25/M40 family metallo-hydrolase [Dehalococcoidia bacterium]|nr:M20/M25/M40 family metallo-hydrolase [Dehalococcoidia bacterium]
MINRQRLVNTFCELVKIDSPSGEEEAVAQDLQRRLTALGFTVARDKYGNLIASEPGESPLMLSAHMDTVEPGRGIKPQVNGDTITSDGTTILGGDCKAGIAAILEALTSAKESRARRFPVQVVLTKGEEVGLLGARNLDFTLVHAKEAVVFDGNGPVTKVTIASPTYVRLTVHVTGRSAHAGVEPEKGLSAIRIAAELITRLPQGRLDPETTFNIGNITGGSVRNAVPEKASILGEFRSRNPKTLDRVRQQVLDTFAEVRGKYPDAQIHEELEVDFPGYSLGADDPLVSRASQVLAGLSLEAELGPTGGGTDANVFSGQGIRCVVVGMSTQAMHTAREFVHIPDLVNAARFCEALLART